MKKVPSIILAIQTALQPYSFCIFKENKLIGMTTMEADFDYSENLITHIQALCEQCKVPLETIEGVGVVEGPGAYTGLRLGLTTAKTIAQIYEIPIVGVASYRTQLFPYQSIKGVYMSVLPARKNEYNVQLFTCKNDVVTPLTDPVSLETDQLVQRLSLFEEPLVVLGLASHPNNTESIHYFVPAGLSSESVAHLASGMFKQGIKGALAEVNPKYSHEAMIGPKKK